jgi:hypothetical protein
MWWVSETLQGLTRDCRADAEGGVLRGTTAGAVCGDADGSMQRETSVEEDCEGVASAGIYNTLAGGVRVWLG